MKSSLCALALVLAGCGATSDYKRATEIEAQIPRALGLGAFAPSCVFLCFTTAKFTHGDESAPAEPGALSGKSSVQRHKEAGGK